jgi:hypothetical protein
VRPDWPETASVKEFPNAANRKKAANSPTITSFEVLTVFLKELNDG